MMTFSSDPHLRNGAATAQRKRLDSQPCQSPAAKAIARKHSVAWKLTLAAFAILCFVVAALIASSASGQDANKYDSIAINPRIDRVTVVRQMKAETRNFASTGRGNGAAVKAYFEQYVPGKLTAADGPEHISEIVSDVTGYLERANKGGRPEIASGLSGLVFRSTEKITKGNYHPTARIAATVLIGGLDAKPADISNRKAPVPMPAALDVLVSLYENEDNVDGIRAAALQGIHRHAMYSFQSMPAETKAKLATMMNDLLDSSAPEGRDITAHAFLQRYAVDILDFTSAAEDASLGIKLVSISTEPKSLEMIALHSASRLATMSKALENKIDDPKKVLWSWTARTLTAFENEIGRIEGMKRRATKVRQPQDPSTHLRKPEEEEEGRRSTMGQGMDRGGKGGGEMNMGRYDDGMMEMSMGGRGRMDMGGYSDGLMDDMGGRGREIPEVVQQPEIIATRRKLNHVLQQVHLGVTGSPTAGMPQGDAGGLLGIADDATKQEIETWANAMEDVIDDINDPMIEMTPEFLMVLKEQIEPLQELVDSMDDHVADADVPAGNDGAKDALEEELMGDEAVEEDLMAEPALLP